MEATGVRAWIERNSPDRAQHLGVCTSWVTKVSVPINIIIITAQTEGTVLIVSLESWIRPWGPMPVPLPPRSVREGRGRRDLARVRRALQVTERRRQTFLLSYVILLIVESNESRLIMLMTHL